MRMHRLLRFRFLLPLVVGLLLLAPITGGAATTNGYAWTSWTETVLHAFNGVDGSSPQGLIEDARGALYGTTFSGGVNGQGTVFQLTPPTRGQTAWTETVLYSFRGNADGAYPYPGAALLADARGALYGTTSGGGGGSNYDCRSFSAAGCGTVFKLIPPAPGQIGWTERVLYAFSGGADGGVPNGELTADAGGSLYGTTLTGGDFLGCRYNFGCGTLFRLAPPASGHTAWTESVLVSFTTFDRYGEDSAYPSSLIADARGALYGTTAQGGDYTCDCGTLFTVIPPAQGRTGGYQLLLAFTQDEGSYRLIANASGAFYATSDAGTFLKLTPPARGQTAWTERALYRFSGGFLSTPSARLIARDGSVYGTTSGAYSGGGADVGTVFRLIPPAPGKIAWTERVLHAFTGRADGGHPSGLIASRRGALYGTTFSGGVTNSGVVFELNRSCPVSNSSRAP